MITRMYNQAEVIEVNKIIGIGVFAEAWDLSESQHHNKLDGLLINDGLIMGITYKED